MKKKSKSDFQEVIDGLHYSWEKLRKHPHKETAGIDGQTILSYSSNYTSNISKLETQLLNNSFKFLPLRRALVNKGREILIQTVNERITSEAILKVIYQYLQKYNSYHDFSRPLRILDGEVTTFEGTPLAVKTILKYFKEGYIWVLETDIKGFFDNVPRKKIYEIVESQVKDVKILEMIKQIIYFTPEVSKKMESKEYFIDKGIAQGSPLSPLLASIYLYEFDMFIINNFPEVKLVRYVDDFIILCKDESTAHKMYSEVNTKIQAMSLEIYKLGEIHKKSGLEKTKITRVRGYGASSFDFLGLSFNNIDVDICEKKKKEINSKIEEIIHTGNSSFFEKTRKIDSRLRAYIDHYKKPHYSRTVSSLNKIIKTAQTNLRIYYITTYKKITHKDPFQNLSDSTTENLFKFMGIDFTNILNLANRPQSTKNISRIKKH